MRYLRTKYVIVYLTIAAIKLSLTFIYVMFIYINKLKYQTQNNSNVFNFRHSLKNIISNFRHSCKTKLQYKYGKICYWDKHQFSIEVTRYLYFRNTIPLLMNHRVFKDQIVYIIVFSLFIIGIILFIANKTSWHEWEELQFERCNFMGH